MNTMNGIKEERMKDQEWTANIGQNHLKSMLHIIITVIKIWDDNNLKKEKKKTQNYRRRKQNKNKKKEKNKD